MKTRFEKIFNKDKNILIGALHFPPLLGYPEFPGLKTATDNALFDLRAFTKGQFDSVIFENNYDVPHKTTVDLPVFGCMAYLGDKLKKNTKLPLGVSILWNDFESALVLSKLLGLKFIRIPAFVDRVKTSYGVVEPVAKQAVALRKKLGIDTALFTDIHVKHSKIISKNNIVQSAKLAIKMGSDALILTGKWTGDAPDLEELKLVRKNIGDFPILLGSGVDTKNIKELFKYANGAIVSTSVKKGRSSKKLVNLKPYDDRIDPVATKKLKAALK